MNPQTCTKFGANRSSRLTASQDFWMCDPLTPPAMPPGVLRGDLYLYAHSQMNQPTWTKVGANRPSRLTGSPDFRMFDPLNPPPKCPLCLSGQFVWRISIPIWICTCVPNLVPFGSAVWHLPLTFEFVTPYPPPPMSMGKLYLAYVHSQTNPQTSTKFGANRSSCLTSSQTWICDPLKPPEMPRVFNLFGIYPFPDESAHVCQIWCQSVQPFGSFSWICATLVQLLATGRAVSRKNTPKNNIYTSKIIIPARTCRQ